MCFVCVRLRECVCMSTLVCLCLIMGGSVCACVRVFVRGACMRVFVCVRFSQTWAERKLERGGEEAGTGQSNGEKQSVWSKQR